MSDPSQNEGKQKEGATKANCPIIDAGNEREQVYDTIGPAPRLPGCVNTR